MVTAIYPSHISIWACFSRWFALRGYECTSQRKESGMAWNGEEAIVERALTGGVFFCHSLDKVSAISLMVNTLFLSHLSLVIYHLPLTLSPFHCLCVCARVCASASCSASVVHLAYVQSSLLSSSLHYSLKMGCHHHRRPCFPPSSASTSMTGHPVQHNRGNGVMLHVHVFVPLIWVDRAISVFSQDPLPEILSAETKVTCQRKIQGIKEIESKKEEEA